MQIRVSRLHAVNTLSILCPVIKLFFGTFKQCLMLGEVVARQGPPYYISSEKYR
jgi:hypothetical protein